MALVLVFKNKRIKIQKTFELATNTFKIYFNWHKDIMTTVPHHGCMAFVGVIILHIVMQSLKPKKTEPLTHLILEL